MLSRKSIEKIGLFNSLFHMYGEDDNYAQRIKYHGFKIGICPQALFWHDRENRVVVKNKSFLKKHSNVEIDAMVLNINQSYLSAYLKVLKYAAYLIYKGLPWLSVKISLRPILNLRKYRKSRRNDKIPKDLI